MATCVTSENLWLQNNFIGDKGLCVMVETLFNGGMVNLHRLLLADNCIGAAGVRATKPATMARMPTSMLPTGRRPMRATCTNRRVRRWPRRWDVVRWRSCISCHFVATIWERSPSPD